MTPLQPLDRWSSSLEGLSHSIPPVLTSLGAHLKLGIRHRSLKTPGGSPIRDSDENTLSLYPSKMSPTKKLKENRRFFKDFKLTRSNRQRSGCYQQSASLTTQPSHRSSPQHIALVPCQPCPLVITHLDRRIVSTQDPRPTNVSRSSSLKSSSTGTSSLNSAQVHKKVRFTASSPPPLNSVSNSPSADAARCLSYEADDQPLEPIIATVYLTHSPGAYDRSPIAVDKVFNKSLTLPPRGKSLSPETDNEEDCPRSLLTDEYDDDNDNDSNDNDANDHDDDDDDVSVEKFGDSKSGLASTGSISSWACSDSTGRTSILKSVRHNIPAIMEYDHHCVPEDPGEMVGLDAGKWLSLDPHGLMGSDLSVRRAGVEAASLYRGDEEQLDTSPSSPSLSCSTSSTSSSALSTPSWDSLNLSDSFDYCDALDGF